MTSTRLLYNDDEYIDGLLDSSPAIIDAIYRHFARKVSSFILQRGGNKKDAAHIFEVALSDIYDYARKHNIELTTRFEPFFMLICKMEWRRELQKRGMDVAAESEPERAALDNTHLRYVQELIGNGERKRHWLHLFQELTPACQTTIQNAVITPPADGAGINPQPTAGLLPETFPSCMSILLKNNGLPNEQEVPPGGYEQVALYAIQALPEAQKAPFEKQLQENHALQEAVRVGKEAIEWLQRALTADNTRRELKQVLLDMRQRWFYTQNKDMNRMGLYVSGITVLAIIMAGLLFISPFRKDVYRQFAPTEMAHHHVPDNDTSRLLHEAAQHFNRRRFARAVELLNRVLQMDPSNTYARYYRGVCLVDINQMAPARTDLQQVYESDSPYRYDAAFYLALSYLRESDKQQSLDWLLKIPQNAPNYWKAKKLIEEIR